MLKFAICDDNNVVCSEMEKLIENYINKANIDAEIEVYNNGKELINTLTKNNVFNAIFLDIEMPEKDGLDVANYLRDGINDNSTKIIYVSAKDSYMKQMFKTQPFDFIQKPIDIIEFEKTLQKLCSILKVKTNTFSYQKAHEYTVIDINKIIYFASEARIIKIVTTDGSDEFYAKLSEIEEYLSKEKFIKVHQSYFVNYDQIISIKTNEIKMSNNKIIPIARKYKKEVEQKQIKFSKERFETF